MIILVKFILHSSTTSKNVGISIHGAEEAAVSPQVTTKILVIVSEWMFI